MLRTSNSSTYREHSSTYLEHSNTYLEHSSTYLEHLILATTCNRILQYTFTSCLHESGVGDEFVFRARCPLWYMFMFVCVYCTHSRCFHVNVKRKRTQKCKRGLSVVNVVELAINSSWWSDIVNHLYNKCITLAACMYM